MDLNDLRAIMDRSKRSSFRLETLPQYLVPQEADDFAAWRAGKFLPPRTPETRPWMAAMKARADQGYRRYRVHIVDYPLSDYTRYELRGYLENQAAGEEINIADRDAHPDLAGLYEDFWLMDDQVAVRMVYDDEGHFLHPELIDDAAPYVGVRDIAMRHAEPLNDYLERKKPELTA